MGTRTVHGDSAGDVPRADTFDERFALAVNRAAAATRTLARPPMAWARHSLEKLPIRMTFGNLGLCAVVLAVVLPRSFTYMLVYPIFRLVFGTLYPAYASYKAVRTRNVKEYVKWMMYWIVFALFTCAETFTDVFLSFWFPFYYEIKIILVLWLLSPATKGSSILYRRFVHPALIRREAEIDEALAKATEQGYTAVLHLGTKGVNYATTVLMQTAIKNFSNVIPATLGAALPGSQSDSAISSLASAKPARTDSRDSPDGPRRRLRSEESRHALEREDVEEPLEESGRISPGDVHVLDTDNDLEPEHEREHRRERTATAASVDDDEDDDVDAFFKKPLLIVPPKQPEKTRKSRKENVGRRHRGRTCKEAVKSYEVDFSDEVDF